MNYQRSESIAAIGSALAKAQAVLEGATKDSLNPHFKNKYADLASVWDACRKVLPANGIAVFQPVTGGESGSVTVTTLLVHTSGEFISADLTLRAQQDTPQGIGSCITYGRRYGLSSLVGVSPEDDDGEAASKPAPSRPVAVPAARLSVPAGYADWKTDMSAAADEGAERLQQAWKDSKVEFKTFVQSSDRPWLDALKAKAAGVAAS